MQGLSGGHAVIWSVLIAFLLFGFLGLNIRLARQESLSAVAAFLMVFLLGVTIAYLFLRSPIIPWLAFILSCFVGLASGYLAAWLWNIRFSRVAIINGIQVSLLRVAADFRISAVLIAVLISYFMTFYFARLSFTEVPPGFWQAFYAAWVSGLLLFTVVGLIVGLVTLYRPERDVFLARVKILLGGKSGTFLNYIAEEIRHIGYVARKIDRVITIEDYDETRNAFRVKVHHIGFIRNILGDVEARATGKFGITPDKFSNPPSILGQITSFKVVGTDPGALPLTIPPDGIVRDWTMPVPQNSDGIMEYEHWAWYDAAQVHDFTLARFAEELTVEFHCRCRPAQKRLMLKLTTALENTDHILDWDGMCNLSSPLRDLSPGLKAYSFHLAVSP